MYKWTCITLDVICPFSPVKVKHLIPTHSNDIKSKPPNTKRLDRLSVLIRQK